MKAIIFGINGQDGFYLNALLNKAGIEVIGVSRRNPAYIIGDVADYPLVEKLIKDNQPNYIFHLAANSTTRHDTVFENYQTISTGTLNILEAVYRYSNHSKVFISGSGLQFVNINEPIAETDPFEARDSYSMARIQSVYAARYYRSLGLNVYVGYFFHHDSPFRHEKHLDMQIIKTALNIKKGLAQILEIGNPEVVKEFNHAYDMANAVWCLVKQNEVFEATLGCGTGYSIQNWIDICFNIIGVDNKANIQYKQNYRPDFLSMISNPSTIKLLGWVPKYDIHYLAHDMIKNG